MAFQIVEGLYIVAYGASDPTDDEWLRYMVAVERRGFERAAQIIFTDGGAPNYWQRRYLAEVLGGRVVPVAVVSPSNAVRAVVTAMWLFNPAIRAFRPGRLYDVVDYLGIDDGLLVFIEKTARLLQSEVYGAAPRDSQ